MRSAPLRLFLPAFLLCVGIGASAFADPGDITVSVKELAGGKAMSGVKLTVRTGGARGDYFTGNDGTTVIPAPEDAPYVVVEASSEGWAPVEQVWNKRGSEKVPNHLDLVMEKAAGISGTVVDQDGKPISGAKILCTVQKQYPNGQRLGVSWTSATADAEGKWAFAGVPATVDKVELGASDKMCLGADGFYGLQPFADLEGLKNGTAKLTLTRGTPVTIVVKDTNGKPVRTARIGYGEDRVASNVLPEEKANAQGEVLLGIAPGAQAVITVQAKAHAPELVRVAIGDKPQTVNITLQPGHTLAGTVLDAQGDAAAGATVYVDTWRGARTLNKRLKVDGEGHFTWPEAPDDEVKVDVLTQNGEKRGVLMKAGGDNKVQIQPPTQFKGTVVDAETGKPITAYSVALGLAFQKDQPINWEMGMQSEREVHKDGNTFDATMRYPYPERAVRVIADGYLPSDSTRFEMDGKDVAFTFKLEKGKPIGGNLLGPDGKPLAGRQVVLVAGAQNIQAQNGGLEEWATRNALTTKSAEDGSFTFPPQRDAYMVAVVTPDGFVRKDGEAFAKDPTLTLQAWGKIEGTLKHGTKPVAAGEVTANLRDASISSDKPKPQLFFFYSAKTDAAGHFAFDHVPPGELSVSEQVNVGRMGINVTSEEVIVEAGKTAAVTLGGKGRAVIGRVQVPAAFANVPTQFQHGSIQLARNDEFPTAYMLKMYALPAKDREAWWKTWSTSPEAKALQAKEREVNPRQRYMQALVKPDGTFEAQSVPEGNYLLNIVMSKTNGDQPWGGEPLGTFSKTFTMPAIPGGVSDEPLDLGTLTMEKIFTGKLGEEEPDLSMKTAGGDEWKLSQQRGKVVLFYLFSTQDDDASAHLDALRAANDAFAKDPRFTMAGVEVQGDPEVLAKYVQDHHLGWTTGQASRAQTISLLQRLDINGYPSAWIIGADGTLLARDIAPDALHGEIEKALKK